MSVRGTETSQESGETTNECRLEAVFQSLPPLGSDEYIEYVSTAAVKDLPPEVLARAFRQLPPESAASRATLQRLFRLQNKKWDYLGPLTYQAQRQRVGVHDDEDVLQDALRRIIEVLPTHRGRYAEVAWNAFCYQEAVDAWRERYGRRGERRPKEKAVESAEDERAQEVFDVGSERPPWLAEISNLNCPQIELIVLRVLEDIPDEFTRAVARCAWSDSKRPKVSGSGRDKRQPFTELFPNKSRHQIHRALRNADIQLAAALLALPYVDWPSDARAVLERRQTNGSPRKRRQKGAN